MSEKSSGALTVTMPSEREIVMTRMFDAPRGLVFQAMSKPEHMKHWFGPHGWTMDLCEIDLRPGGAWRWVLRGPDGKTMGMRGVYREVAPPGRMVTTESFDDYPGESVNTLTLEEEGSKTRFTVRVLYGSQEIRDAVARSGMEKGAGETYDRLAKFLAGEGGL